MTESKPKLIRAAAGSAMAVVAIASAAAASSTPVVTVADASHVAGIGASPQDTVVLDAFTKPPAAGNVSIAERAKQLSPEDLTSVLSGREASFSPGQDNNNNNNHRPKFRK